MTRHKLLWLWRSLAAVAPITPLAWEPPYAMGVALKSIKKKKYRFRMYLSTNYLVLVLVEWSRGKVSASKTKRALPLKNGPKANFLELSLRLNLLENFYTCMCVCVCVCVCV